jgi:RNA polymerase sigma-70 factor (ECF subfamily)
MSKWFQELFDRYNSELNAFLRRRGHDRDAAADLTQDTFVRVLQSVDGLELRNPQAYLHKVALNLSVDSIRRERRRPKVNVSDDELARVVDPSPSPEIIVSDRQRLAIAESVLEDLPDRVRYAFEAHRMGEKTITQIADELGLSTTRTWTLIRKGYEQLRARFNEDIE